MFSTVMLAGTIDTPNATDPSPLGRLVDVGQYRVHLYCTGEGRPTVMIAGGGFSFDWALVQSQVSKLTQVCTFDPSGTTWSDPFPARTAENASAVTKPTAEDSSPTCGDRVDEIHRLLLKAPVEGPYVFVGFSIGALWARIYALEYPDEIVGMVLVDHAFLGPDLNDAGAAGKSASDKRSAPPSAGQIAKNVDTPPVLISTTPITIGFEDDWNFKKLPERDQQLHLWAMRQHPLRPTAEMAANCFSLVDKLTDKRAYPLGNLDVAVISTDNDTPGYAQLQNALLSLSHRTRHLVAHGSSHMMPIDNPQAIVSAISEMLQRKHPHGVQ